jgi:hypothetical protein
MAITMAETAEVKEQRENLIETKYVGDYERFKGTEGEAFYNVISNSWHYRPYKNKEDKFFIEVKGEDLDCANDSGWVNVLYKGDRNIKAEGKARWSEEKDAWEYKPKGFPRLLTIPENDITIVRDKDYGED